MVYVQPDDDVATICGKIDTAAYQRVLLVAPRGNKALQSLLGMTILRRHAEVTGRDIAIVSGRSLRARASRQGIKNFGSLRNAKFDVKPPAQLIIPLGNSDIVVPYGRLARFAVIGSIVIVFLVAAYLFIPSASITIYPDGRTVTESFSVIAATTQDEIDAQGMRVPAEFVEVPVVMNMAVQTTGRVPVGDAFARGTAVFTNKTANAVTIPKETRLATNGGLVFATQTEAILNGGTDQTVRVDIQAVRAGTRGNAGVNTVTVVEGPLQNSVSVTNPAAMAGGTDKEAQGVASEDVDNLVSLVSEAMKAEGLRLLTDQYSSDEFYLYSDTARSFIDENKLNYQIGEATPLLITSATGRVRVLSTKMNDLQQIAGQTVSTLSSGERPTIVKGTFNVVEANLSEVDEVTSQLNLRTEMEVVDGLDEDELVDELKGRSAASARTYLNGLFPMRQAPDIDITPGWGFGISRFDWRIDLKVKGAPKPEENVWEQSVAATRN